MASNAKKQADKDAAGTAPERAESSRSTTTDTDASTQAELQQQAAEGNQNPHRDTGSVSASPPSSAIEGELDTTQVVEPAPSTLKAERVSVKAGLDEGLNGVIVKVTGTGNGDHQGYLRISDEGRTDHKVDLRWHGEELTYRFPFLFSDGIFGHEPDVELRFKVDGPMESDRLESEGAARIGDAPLAPEADEPGHGDTPLPGKPAAVTDVVGDVPPENTGNPEHRPAES